jgi:pyruvate/2-oxoglutarate dehydrogenase complex dihydrolipoamide dehydrogenase (E3) component
MTTRYDAIIVGAGQAGPPLADRLTAAGQTVALIERDRVGGTCVNVGCTPTKTLVASARAAHVARRAADFGVEIAGPVTIDMAKVKARADLTSGNSRRSVEGWLAGMPGLTLIRGHARFTAPDTLTVNGETITAGKIFLNVGARPTKPDIPGADTVPVLDSTAMLALTEVPRHLAVIGGSYIGLEFGQIFRRLGAEVTVIERHDRLAGREDAEISDAIREIFEAEGITVITGAACIGLKPHADGAEVEIGGRASVIASHVLVAAGRTPNTDDLGLEAAGIQVDKRGFVPVNDRLETDVPGIWALGDCNGRGAFTHTSWNDYEIVAANLFDGATRKVSDRILGYALYIDPPLGRVGLTERAARDAGHDVLVSTRPMARVGRAVERDETAGLMKLVADGKTKKILGAAILGIEGDEAIHGILDMMNAGTTYDVLQGAVPIHPTVSELIPTVVGGLGRRS